MSYRIETVAPFRKAAKKLSKNYPSLKEDLEKLGEQLIKSPSLGIALGNNCFKIRLAITSKGKGKAGGARVITHFFIDNETVYLLSIYDKSDQVSISDKEIKELLAQINR